MQQKTVELKDKLIKALDKENNVIDMRTVLDVVTQLENHEITVACLEETRIGKYINGMRKQTSDKSLAKRAKNLVKKWQDLYQKTLQPAPIPQDKQLTTPTSFNGKKLSPKTAVPQYLTSASSHKPASPLSQPSTPGSNTSSPGLQQRLPGGSYSSKPLYGNATTTRVQSSSAAAFKPVSPALKSTSARSDSPLCLGRTGSPFEIMSRTHNGHGERSLTPSEGHMTSSPASKRKRFDMIDARCSPDSKRHRKDDVQSSSSGTKTTAKMNGHLHSSSNANIRRDSPIIGESDSGNGKLKRSKTALELKTYQRTPSSAASSLTDSLPKTPSVKTPRVKTTAQLLEDLASAGSLNLKGSEAVRKITLNQIDKEHIEDVPVVPAGAKPRQKRKRQAAPPATNKAALHETKHEMVHKFLETSHPEPPTPDVDLGTSGASLAGHGSRTPGAFNTGVVALPGDQQLVTDNGQKPTDAYSRNNNQHLNDGLTSLSEDQRRVSPVRIKLGARSGAPTHEGGCDSVDASALNASIIPKAGAITQQALLEVARSDPWSLLPAIDPDGIQWNCLDYEPPVRRFCDSAVTSSVIERLHSEQWSGVNGQCDRFGQWRTWTQCQTSRSYAGDSLHILPYVVGEGLNGDIVETPSSDNEVSVANDDNSLAESRANSAANPDTSDLHTPCANNVERNQT